MPIYEYACPECEREFELLLRGSERPVCPSCGSGRIERQISVPAVHSSGRSQSLPICAGNDAPPCGPGFCRTGQCQFD